MVLLIGLAIFGAALGAFLRPRIIPVVLTLVLIGAARAGADIAVSVGGKRGDHPAWVETLSSFLDAPLHSYLFILVTGGGGAAFAAFLCLFVDEKAERPFWMPADGAVRNRDKTAASSASPAWSKSVPATAKLNRVSTRCSTDSLRQASSPLRVSCHDVNADQARRSGRGTVGRSEWEFA